MVNNIAAKEFVLKQVKQIESLVEKWECKKEVIKDISFLISEIEQAIKIL